jgi:hypothetical protein
MWKIFFTYSDKSACTITGKTSDITLEQAIKYHKQYGVHAVNSIYQKYPKVKNEPKDLYDVVSELKNGEQK